MNLSERFAESRGEPVEVDGHVAVPIVRIPCREGDRFHVHLSTPAERDGQGVSMSLKRGRVSVNGQELKDVVLWEATAPSTVEVAIVKMKKSGELLVWNCWRGPQNQIMAWLGNAGMVVEHDGDAWRFRCSDGTGNPSFDDLFVEITRMTG